MKKKIIYWATILFAILYIAIGASIATKNIYRPQSDTHQTFEKAVVTGIISRTSAETQVGGTNFGNGINILFEARITSGKHKGETVNAIQNYDHTVPGQIREVSEGDKIILLNDSTMGTDVTWFLAEYVRADIIILLAVAFMLFLIIFGRVKGLNTIISLLFTCLSIFAVFIPAILSGMNVYFWSILTSAFIVSTTLLIVNGADYKSLAAGAGCAGGVVVSAVLIELMDKFLRLTGMINDEAMYLLMLNQKDPIDLRAIVFGSIIIGAIGAILDVSMDIASSLKEIAASSENPTASALFRSGMSIGRDIIGTMANTLILAYIGSSLSLVLLLVAYNNSLLYIFNQEMIVVELLQSLVGSFGIMFAIPFTSIVAGTLYSLKK